MDILGYFPFSISNFLYINLFSCSIAKSSPLYIKLVLTRVLFLPLFKDNLLREKERNAKEIQRFQAQLEQFEQKQSSMLEENVDYKEKLSRADLSREVLDQEKTNLMEMFQKTESQKEELDAEGRFTLFLIWINFSFKITFEECVCW